LHLISHHSKGADAALPHSLRQECDGRVLGIIGAVDASVPFLPKSLFGQARSIGRIGRNQHAKWLKVCNHIPWRRPIASLNYLLSSHVWRQDHTEH
jgi:D-xylulose 5-phosphate/D-fructose 6-phosphate phosphoketolase